MVSRSPRKTRTGSTRVGMVDRASIGMVEAASVAVASAERFAGPSKFYPINPTLTKDGLFAALAHLPHAERYRPWPDTVTGQSRFNQKKGREDTEDISILASLDVVGILDARASYSTQVLYRDVMAYHEPLGPGPTDSLIRGIRWGAGFRLTLVVSAIEAELALDTHLVAVASELGLASSSFEIKAYGLVDPSVLKKVPTAGRFDTDAYAALQQAEQDIRVYMDQHIDDLQAVPFDILLTEFPVVRVAPPSGPLVS